MNIKRIFLLFVLFGILPLSITLAIAEPLPFKNQVVYDQETDQLTIDVRDQSLKKVLISIARQSRAEISMDPAAEKNISLTIKPTKLQDGLKNLAKQLQLNHALIFSGQTPQGTPMVVGMKILPEGKASSVGLEPLLDMTTEIAVQARQQSTDMPQSEMRVHNYARARWSERLQQMPEEKRVQIDARIEQRLVRQAEIDTRRTENREKSALEKSENEVKRTARDEQMKAEDPERYQRLEQKREERKEQYLQQLKEENMR